MSDEYDALLASQGGGCAICGRPAGTRRLHVDHDHKVRGEVRIRGLLCHRHNRGLQMFQDNPDHLDRAAQYLRDAATL